jgi:hypothetical protein
VHMRWRCCAGVQAWRKLHPMLLLNMLAPARRLFHNIVSHVNQASIRRVCPPPLRCSPILLPLPRTILNGLFRFTRQPLSRA